MIILKIVIFEPHPDDLLMGAGQIIFNWIEQGHDIHIITVTDGRACYRKMKDDKTSEALKMTEDEIAIERLTEAKKSVEFLGLPSENLHLLKFPDAKAQDYIKEGIKTVIPIIKDVDRLLLPSDHNFHEDHQATHDIAIGAAKVLQLRNIEYWVYFVPQYGRFNKDSKNKLITIKISEELRQKLTEWLQIYQSQKRMKNTWKLYTRYLKFTKEFIYGKYKYEDIGKFYNF
ncbi:MAG: PIG-L deacetylase family protein [Promethearchaeota archaeon]